MLLAIDLFDIDDENLRCDSSLVLVRKRVMFIVYSVVRKLLSDSASANGGVGVVVGGESGFGFSVAYGTMELLFDVFIVCDSSSEPDSLHPLMTARKRAANWSSRAY